MNETIKRDSENRRQDVQNSRLQRFPTVPVLSLLVAVIALMTTINELNESRMLRQTQLSRWTMEGLAEARQMDSGKRAVDRKDGKARWKCSGGRKQLSARAGQISTLERMARIEPNLRDIVAHDVNLVIDRSRQEMKKGLYGINLENADLSRAGLHNTNLRNANLSGVTLTEAELNKSCLRDAILTGSHLIDADLSRSDLSKADLSDADLTRADLYQANFSSADFTNATLIDADIGEADFSRAKGLTQPQLDSACADEDAPPTGLPKAGGNKLTWNGRVCK